MASTGPESDPSREGTGKAGEGGDLGGVILGGVTMSKAKEEKMFRRTPGRAPLLTSTGDHKGGQLPRGFVCRLSSYCCGLLGVRLGGASTHRAHSRGSEAGVPPVTAKEGIWGPPSLTRGPGSFPEAPGLRRLL